MQNVGVIVEQNYMVISEGTANLYSIWGRREEEDWNREIRAYRSTHN